MRPRVLQEQDLFRLTLKCMAREKLRNKLEFVHHDVLACAEVSMLGGFSVTDQSLIIPQIRRSFVPDVGVCTSIRYLVKLHVVLLIVSDDSLQKNYVFHSDLQLASPSSGQSEPVLTHTRALLQLVSCYGSEFCNIPLTHCMQGRCHAFEPPPLRESIKIPHNLVLFGEPEKTAFGVRSWKKVVSIGMTFRSTTDSH